EWKHRRNWCFACRNGRDEGITGVRAALTKTVANKNQRRDRSQSVRQCKGIHVQSDRAITENFRCRYPGSRVVKNPLEVIANIQSFDKTIRNRAIQTDKF